MFQKANNKGADQTARMSRLVCAFVVRKSLKTGGPYILGYQLLFSVRDHLLCWIFLTFCWLVECF